MTRLGFDNKELLATALLLKGMEKPLAKQINAQTKRVVVPEWKKALAGTATTKREQKVLASTATVDVKNYGVVLKSGVSSKRLSGGIRASEIARATEFGANRFLINRARSRKGKTYRRHTQRQFVTYLKTGRAVYPAAAEMIPRIAALWVQTTVRTFWEELKRGK